MQSHRVSFLLKSFEGLWKTIMNDAARRVEEAFLKKQKGKSLLASRQLSD